jgi:hypothetical protein
MLLQFGTDACECHRELTALAKEISVPGFFQLSEEQVPLRCCMSIDDGMNFEGMDAIAESLSQGVYQASLSETSCVVSKQSGEWSTEQPASLELAVSPAETAIDDGSNLIQKPSIGKTIKQSDSNEPARSIDSTHVSDSVESQVDATSKGNEETPSATGIEAYATADDIQALFSQIQANATEAASSKEESPAPVSEPVSDTVSESEIAAAPANSTNDTKDVASAEDIAALFSQVEPSGPNTSSVDTARGEVSIATANAKADFEAVDADEIAALFASRSPISGTVESETSTGAPPGQAVGERLADPNVKLSQLPLESAAVLDRSSPNHPNLNALLGEVSENTSASDIASLFAGIQK